MSNKMILAGDIGGTKSYKNGRVQGSPYWRNQGISEFKLSEFDSSRRVYKRSVIHQKKSNSGIKKI